VSHARSLLLLVLSGCPAACQRSSAAHNDHDPAPLPLVALAGAPTASVTVEPALAHAAPPLPPGVCPKKAPLSGPREVTVDGLVRTVHLDFPDDTSSPRPLVLAFHGWGGDPDQLERTTGLGAAANRRGWIAARPLGVGKSFHAGRCCGEASERGIDDVALARATIDLVAQEACIDRRRVYSTGFSNGGFLSHRLGCEAADAFAAVASVGGTFAIDRCAPSRPVSVLHIHGKIDAIVKFGGDEAKGWSSVATVIDAWVRADRCALDSAREVYGRGADRCVRSGACAGDAEVTLCRDDRAGHTWPGGPRSIGYGGSQDLDSTTMILDFFARHAI
jgi:polyhydroxybutyrate depolymerase